MKARNALIAAVAAALGVWVAIAAAEGGVGAGGTNGCTYYSTSAARGEIGCPRGFGVGSGAGSPQSKHHRHHARHAHHGRPGAPGPGALGSGSGRHRHHNHLTFTFVVRLGRGASAASVTGYSAHVLPPRHASASCQARVLRIALKGRKHQLARVRVRPPQGGWCRGRYRVTVSLKH